MTVQEYLEVTRSGTLWFLTSPEHFEEVKVCIEKWGPKSWPPALEKWLPKQVSKVFVDSNGRLTIHTI